MPNSKVSRVYFGLCYDSYFFYHHTQADTVSVLDSDQMDKSAAVLAVTAYAVAMLDERLPRGGDAALQSPEERALISARVARGGLQCAEEPTESYAGPRRDVLTPAQCAIVLSRSVRVPCNGIEPPKMNFARTIAFLYNYSAIKLSTHLRPLLRAKSVFRALVQRQSVAGRWLRLHNIHARMSVRLSLSQLGRNAIPHILNGSKMLRTKLK
eukprot:SAG31_NODE_177_length_21310_cov_8.894064_12_plen_211_part_00